jgi:DNA polymerase-3 subunit epsilon
MTIYQHRPLVFLDIETTGGSPTGSAITEIGAVRVEAGRVVGKFSQLLDPGAPVPWFITKLTGIDDAMLQGQPQFAAIAAELRQFLESAVFVAHNVAFDYGFIQAAYRQCGQDFHRDRFCTAKLSRRLYPEQRRHNLDTIISTHGFSVANRHRALDDALVLFEFYTRAVEQHGLAAFAAIQAVMIQTPKPV